MLMGSDSRSKPLLEVIDLKVHFPVYKGALIRRETGLVKAVDGVSLTIQPGETVGLVGESGCGKSTLGRAIVGLTAPTSGAVVFRGQNIDNMTQAERSKARRRVQMIFQDPYASLNPRMTIGETIAEPVILHGLRTGREAVQARVTELLRLVELDPALAERYPHQFSGGQRQRIGIARALACEPDLIVCDEAVSALDVSIQAQIVKLLQRLQAELKIAYLFIAHGLGVVKQISSRVAVMYLGKIVEAGSGMQIFRDPRHAYTRALISAAPVPDPVIERRRQRIVLTGDLPSPLNPPAGCRFHTRCPIVTDICRSSEPSADTSFDNSNGNSNYGHMAACWRSGEIGQLMPLVKTPA